MDGELRQSGKQMLAPAHGLLDRLAGEVDLGQLRDAEVSLRQLSPAQRLVEAAGREPDGVTLGHVVPPSQCQRPGL